MKYHCGVGKKDLLNFEKFLKFFSFFGVCKSTLCTPFTAKCAITTCVKKLFVKHIFPGFFWLKVLSRVLIDHSK